MLTLQSSHSGMGKFMVTLQSSHSGMSKFMVTLQYSQIKGDIKYSQSLKE